LGSNLAVFRKSSARKNIFFSNQALLSMAVFVIFKAA